MSKADPLSRVLITGGAGLIGSHIADLLVSEEPHGPEREIIILDDFTRGRWENLEDALNRGNVRVVEGDIRDRELVHQLMHGIDLVFHQAAIRINRCAKEPRLAMEVLVEGTFNIVEAAARRSVRKVVAASSASVYGEADEFPTSEDHHPYNNKSIYGAAKTFNEGLLRSFYTEASLDYVALRYFNVYGPRMDIHGRYTEVLVRWMERIESGQRPLIYGEGSETLDIVFAADVARANVLAAKSDLTDVVLNVASGREVSLKELASMLLKAMGSDLVPEYVANASPFPMRRRLGDVQAAKRTLGFEAGVPPEEGIPRLVKWWRAERSRSTSKTGKRDGVQFIPVAKPVLGDAEIEAVKRPLRSGWVTQGPEVGAFEEEFASYVGAKHACAVSSCTAALHLALLACGIEPGDEVITASHSFIATANSIRYCGAIPLFVDIDPATFNMDPAQVAQAIGPRTRAILCVHQMGMPADLTAILAVARDHRIPVIEDAACALGSEILFRGNWERIGKPHGQIACFSFHPRKIVTMGEGGVITTNDSAMAERIRLLRHHGMSVSDLARHRSPKVIREKYEVLGFNYRLSDIQAAIGREQLKRLPEIVPRRRALAARYHEMLAGIETLSSPDEPEWARSNFQSYCIRLGVGVSQNAVIDALLEAGVATRPGIPCAHSEPAYARGTWSCAERSKCDCAEFHCRLLTNGEEAQAQCMLLPIFDRLTETEQDRVVETLTDALHR